MLQSGRKHSAKRDAILTMLKSTGIHPGARWVHEKLKGCIPGLSLGTVYRNLSLFREEGTALSLGTVGGEERFDGIVEPHPHFICSRCGVILDLPPEEASALLKSCKKIPEKKHFSIDFRRTIFYGLCKTCRGIEPEETA